MKEKSNEDSTGQHRKFSDHTASSSTTCRSDPPPETATSQPGTTQPSRPVTTIGLDPKHPLEKTFTLEEEQGGQNEDDDSEVSPIAAQLARASLSHADAKDRHEEFPSLLAESAALVERMLGDQTDSIREEALPLSRHSLSYGATQHRSGSVLGSLMRMEHQRHHHKAKTASDDRPVKKRPKRPRLTTSTSSSWLSDMAKSNHLVPSLDKRKADSASKKIGSRRTSLDSTKTYASQFEPISLEDRIRITFEIANLLQKQTFLRKLVKCLMLYGCPAHRLEYILREVSKTLHIQAEFVYLPNIMLMSFVDPDMHTTETHFVRQIQAFDMHKLGEIFRLQKLVSHGEVTVDEALEFVDKVITEPDFYPVWIVPFTYALASFCGCVMFFGGTWREAGLACALAVFFAIYELISGRLVSFQPIYEVTCCIIIGFIARAVGKFNFCFTPVAFASFIIILPGYSMAISIVELVSRQLVCGVVRMVYAIIYSFLLGYGITMGSALYTLIDPSSINQKNQQCQRTETASTCLANVPELYYILTVPLFAVAYCIFLRARMPRWPVMIAVAVSGFVINWALACQATSPSQVIQVVPAFAIGLLGNLYTKFTQKMSFDAVLLGVFYMVPGGLGLKSALGFFGTASGSEFSNQGGGFALSMIETSIGISIGLFVATLVVYPKGTAHTPLMSF